MLSLDVVNNQIQGFPHGSVVKNPPDNAGDTGVAGSASSVPGSGRSPARRNGNPVLPRQSHGLSSLEGYSLGVAKSWTQLSERMHTHTHTRTPIKYIHNSLEAIKISLPFSTINCEAGFLSVYILQPKQHTVID